MKTDSCNVVHLNLQGFVIVRDFFEPSELQPCLHAVDELVDQLAVRLFQAEKINGLLLFVRRRHSLQVKWRSH